MVKTRTLRQTKKADSAGFTLLELLVVLTIVALSAYLIAPHFQGRKGKSDIVFLTAEMQSQLSLARSISISKNKPVTFSLDVKSRSFNIDGNLPTAISENIDIELLVGTSSEQYTDIGKITFYPDGTSTGGKITLSKETHKQVIEIHWINGQIKHVQT